MRKLVVLLAALAVMTSSIVGPTRDSASAGSVPVMAPVSAEYLAAQRSNDLPGVVGRPLGFVPSPVDLSHLTSFQPTGQDALGAPAQYDLRTLGRLSPVKNQGSCSCCWTFAAYGSLESVVYPTEQWDFSEQNLMNLSGFDYGACGGGNATMAVAYMARWAGPVREADDPYNAGVSTSPAGLTVPRYLSAALAIPDRKNALDYPLDYPLDNAALKSAVQQWGAVQTSMYWTDGSYNEGPHSYYYNGSGTSNHAVAIVGWDDSYSRLNFKTAPAGDGAFIIRNNWGTGWGDAGYFYVSYYDSVIGRNNWVFVLGTGAPVDTHNYGYDDLGWVGSLGFASPTAWGANVFTLNAGSGSEVIDRVGFYTTDSGTSYTLRIYGTVSGAVFSNKLTEESGAFDEAGYHTVSLASPVTVAHGEKIAVAVGMTTSGWAYPLAYEYAQGGYSSAAVAAPGQSYRSSNGTSWSDLTSLNTTANLCIRAFTHDAVPSVPSAPILSSPADLSTAGSLTPILAWCAAAGATSYTVQVNRDIAFFGAPQFIQSGVTGTSITTTSLPAGTLLYWRANARNAVGTSAWSSTWSFTTPAALEKPAVPILLSPPSGGPPLSTLAATLTWAASARATSYTVDLSARDYFPTPLVWSQSTTGTSVTTPTLAPSTLYFWHVTATNAAGSVTTVQHNFTTPAVPVTPLAPVLSSPADGTTLGSLTPTLTWAIAAGAASYTVQVSHSSTFGTTVLSQTTSATSLTTPTLAAATRHYWRVNATNAAGTSPWSSIRSFTTPPVYTLTLDTIGSGSVVKSPNQSSYVSGTVVTLTATPLAGYTFTSWSGDLTGSTNPTTVTMNANKAVTATFTPDAYTLTVTPPVNGTVTKSPDQATYSYGTVVTLTATPAFGYGFVVWTGNLSGSTNPVTIAMTGNRTVTATFTALPTYVLSTTASPTLGGTIGKSPNQSSYLAGTVVTLTAAPLAGYAFTGWSGSLSGTTNPATLTMNANKSVTATFAVVPARTLNVSVTGSGFVVKSPNMSVYPSGTVVTLTATPLAGYTFTGWSGDL
ncbi:MAG TPA: lectin like domain-containing protein, partial [Candidatus Cryosericum sp.]